MTNTQQSQRDALAALSKEQLIALLARAQAPRAVTMKVGAKGGVSLYGLGRFPVTLYASQWERLADEIPAVLAFIKANASLVSRKA